MDDFHTHYYTVMETMNKEECPVCSLMKKAMGQYFEHLIHDAFSDEEFILEFRARYGFCHEHAHQFRSYNNGLAAGSTYRYMLILLIEELKSGKHRYFKKEIKPDCPACAHMKEKEKDFLFIIQEYCDEPAFHEKFKESPGLCAPHYKDLLEKTKGKLPKWLQEFQVANFEAMLTRVYKFLDWSNYSLLEGKPDLTRQEQLIWQEAIDLIAGKKNAVRPG